MLAAHVQPPASFLTYNEAWNTTDVSAVRGLLEKAVTPDVVFVAEDGRIRRIDGFFGALPPLP